MNVIRWRTAATAALLLTGCRSGPQSVDGELNCDALKPDRSNSAFKAFPHPASPLSAVDASGASVGLDAWRGRVVLLNFWAPWCAPCVKELPTLEALGHEFPAESLTIVTVASDSDWAKVRAMIPEASPLIALLEGGPPAASGDEHQAGSNAHAWGTQLLPESYLIDRHGVVRYYFGNKRDWASAAAKACVASLLREEPGESRASP